MSLTQGKCRVFTTERTKLKHVVRELKDNIFEPEGNQEIVKAIGFRSNYLVDVKTPTGSKYLVSIPSKFRNRIWIQKGQYIIVEPIAEGKKVKAEVVHVLFPDHVRHLQSNDQWPKAFDPPFPCRYKELRAGVDEKLKEERRVEAEEETCAVAAAPAAAAARRSDSESEEDDESDLFVNVNRQYLHGPPIVQDASDDESDEEDSEEEDEEAEDEDEDEEDGEGEGEGDGDGDSRHGEEEKEGENGEGASADTDVSHDEPSAAESCSPAAHLAI